MTAFDISAIGGEAIRQEYAHLQRRAETLAASFAASQGRPASTIAFRYINESEFNAFASREGDGYLVELNAAVPLFVIILFYRLLTDPRVLPHLDASGMVASDFELPFIVDPDDFDRRVDWKIAANPMRAFAAGTLADLCSTFVILHEFAHVLCGHADGLLHYESDRKLAEMVRRASQTKVRPKKIDKVHKAGIERRKAWEADADVIAGAFLVQAVDELIHQGDERAWQVFSHAGGFHLEHTLAITVTALFAFFCYVQGARDKLNRTSDHPHPQVRALLVKDILLQVASQRWDIDGEKFHALLDERMDEMMEVLEDIGLFDPAQFTAAFDRKLDRERAGLDKLRERYRESCRQWCWVEW
ncbi:hypothetical protein [Xanthobacter autotrophicus]|uniref:hypothetical protein n=1 Tax=Xanthobacter autotrophicus TaxID=280 RepID=UPI00372764D3